MLNPLKPFTTPEYLFRPRQIGLRIKRQFVAPTQAVETVRLPWGTPLRIRPSEVIGANIWYYGIFELLVAEAIARLLDRDETAIDIGANVGQMTTLMRKLASKDGRVLAFEPHPEIFGELRANMNLASQQPDSAPVELHPVGLSDTPRAAHLDLGTMWDTNQGMARVADPGSNGARVQVQLTCLDALFPPGEQCGVCKIDVEGHELEVLRGAEKTLSSGRIRDIIFEDLSGYESRSQQFLCAHGFTTFALRKRLFGPVVCRPEEREQREKPSGDSYSFLATKDPQRALTRFRPRGWRCLGL